MSAILNLLGQWSSHLMAMLTMIHFTKYISDRLQRLQSEVNKIEEKNYKISEMENEISDLRSSLKSRLNEIDELKSDLFESSYLNQSKCSDVSITMPAKS